MRCIGKLPERMRRVVQQMRCELAPDELAKEGVDLSTMQWEVH